MKTIAFYEHANGADPLNTLIPAYGELPAVPYMTKVYQSAIGPTRLYMGGVHPHMALPADIRYIVSLHPTEYKGTFNQGRYAVQFNGVLDDPEQDPEIFDVAADVASGFIEMHNGGVLIHCMAGVNRSGVVTALTLIKKFGWSADMAISYLRETRSRCVLFNEAFETYVREWSP